MMLALCTKVQVWTQNNSAGPEKMISDTVTWPTNTKVNLARKSNMKTSCRLIFKLTIDAAHWNRELHTQTRRKVITIILEGKTRKKGFFHLSAHCTYINLQVLKYELCVVYKAFETKQLSRNREKSAFVGWATSAPVEYEKYHSAVYDSTVL